MKQEKYYVVKKKYLADALSFLGFRYYKYGRGKDAIYSFLDNAKFREALTELMNLKSKINN